MQFSVSFDLADSPDLSSLSTSEQQAILDTANAAATIWSWYLTPASVTLSLALSVDNSLFSGSTLAEGGAAGLYWTGAMFGGARVYDSGTSIELRTGVDRNGSASDLNIYLTVNSIRNMMSFKTDDTAAVPFSRVDALSVFLHEIGHGLGFSSFDGSSTAATVYDALILNGSFIGTNAELVAGGPVLLEPGSISHISESGPFRADLMSPAISNGVNQHISALDLAVLQDIGVPLRQATSGADVMHAIYGVALHLGAGNDTGYAVGGGSTVYGEDGIDLLYGSKSTDVLYGGNGNDTLEGGGGNDTLDGGAGSDIARYSGLASNYQITRLASNSFQIKDTRLSSPDGWDILTDVERVQWSDGSFTGLIGSAPFVSTANISALRNQTLSLASLISVTDADGDTITAYQLWDSARDPSSGHFVVNGVVQAAATVIDISAAQFSLTTFVTGSVGDSLQIRAFDGSNWSAADNAAWAPFQVAVPNVLPVLSTSNLTAQHGQTLALSSLFSVSDADGDPITAYQLWDSTRDPASGHFVINGVAQAAGVVIDVTAAQLAQTSFITGAIGDVSLQIRAFDGAGWSAADTVAWAPFSISVPSYSSPTVSTANVAATRNQTMALSSLFSVSDTDGDTMTKYQLWDSTSDPNSGHFVLNGVVQAANTVIDITAAQLSLTSFIAGKVSDNLQIRAFDGIGWSAADTAAWAPFAISVLANNASVVTTSTVSALHGRTLALSSLFSVSDTDGDTMTKYQLWDSTSDPSSGHFVVGGVARAAGTVIDVSAAQLAGAAFFTGAVSDNLQIRAYDGLGWSAADTDAWAPFTVSVAPYTLPTVATADVTATSNQTLALSSLFSVSDTDGDTMTQYQLWDSTRDPSSGYFVVNGVAQAAGTVIDITAAQLASTSFVTGTVNDNLQIRAFDGFGWSAPDNAAWSPFHVS